MILKKKANKAHQLTTKSAAPIIALFLESAELMVRYLNGHSSTGKVMSPKLQALLDKYTFGLNMKRTLSKRLGADRAENIMARVWNDYHEKLLELSPMATWRGNLNLRFAVISVGLYKSFLAEGLSKNESREALHHLAWDAYKIIGNLAWYAGKRKNKLSRVRRTMKIFRKALFPEPDFGWEEVREEENTVGFNCTKCPIASHFERENLSEVCVESICSLDEKLSEQWGIKFVREKTIAGGSDICDFRWKEE